MGIVGRIIAGAAIVGAAGVGLSLLPRDEPPLASHTHPAGEPCIISDDGAFFIYAPRCEDGRVKLGDDLQFIPLAGLMSQCMSGPGTPPVAPEPCVMMDRDRDGDVDLRDVASAYSSGIYD